MRVFKYDIVQLIQGVRDRPCIWDKTLVTYKDRAERRVAWEEVFLILDKTYDKLSDEEKRLTGEHILNKWTNIRDTYIKSLKTKNGKPKKKYIFHNQLKFLIQSEQIAPEDANQTELLDDDMPPHPPEIKSEIDETPMYSPPKITRKYVHSKEQHNSNQNYDKTLADVVEIDELDDPRLMNEDEAFFASLLPSIVNYSEDERLQFRIEVLDIMKRISDKRKWPNVTK